MFPNTKFTNTHLSLDSEVCMFMCVHACLVCYIQHFKKFVLFFFTLVAKHFLNLIQSCLIFFIISELLTHILVVVSIVMV